MTNHGIIVIIINNKLALFEVLGIWNFSNKMI